MFPVQHSDVWDKVFSNVRYSASITDLLSLGSDHHIQTIKYWPIYFFIFPPSYRSGPSDGCTCIRVRGKLELLEEQTPKVTADLIKLLTKELRFYL